MLFAALIGPYFINWTSYRQDFEREASRILGQKVEVLGTAEARLLPFPSVTFNDVRVENAKTGATMMTVAHFSMDAELAPFLRGQILIFDMRIDGPRGTIRLLPDGSLDWALRNGDDHARRVGRPGERRDHQGCDRPCRRAARPRRRKSAG